MSSRRLAGLAVELAWSQWTALGVSGTASATETVADPEALIPFTATLGEHDARLRDEAQDWCIQYGSRFVSTARLRNIVRRFDEQTRADFELFAATVNANAGTRWPTNASARGFRASGKSRLASLSPPPRALLRFRAAFGISARAEILLALLTDWSSNTWTSTARFAELGYGHRNVASILDDLAMSEVLESKRVGNANTYRLRDAETLRALLAPVPRRFGHWQLRLPILAASLHLAQRVDGKTPSIRGIEAAKFLETHADAIRALDLAPPPLDRPDRLWDRFAAWIAESMAATAPAAG